MNGGWTHESETEKGAAPAAVDPAAHGHRPRDAPRHRDRFRRAGLLPDPAGQPLRPVPGGHPGPRPLPDHASQHPALGMPTVNWTALFGLVNAVGIFFYPDVV